MINLDDMKKRLSEDLAREAGEVDQGEPISGQEKAKENSKEVINNDDIVLTTDNITDYLDTCPIDDKNNHVVPDNVFNKYYRILPAKVVNESGTYRSSGTGGKLKIFGGDPEADKAIHKKGGEALQAAIKQRRSMADTLDILLRQPADPETIEALNLPAGATKQDAMLAAMYLQATEGNVKAGQFVRDTIGEQPTQKQEIDIMTDDDRKLLANISDRLT